MRDADKAFLGVDIGTSSIAAVVTDADGSAHMSVSVLRSYRFRISYARFAPFALFTPVRLNMNAVSMPCAARFAASFGYSMMFWYM